MSFFPIIPPTINPVTVTATDSDSSASSLTTYTFSAMDVDNGNGDVARKLTFGITADQAVSSMTVGGQACTKAINLDLTGDAADLWYVDVGAGVIGTTADVVITLAAGSGRCGVFVHVLENAATGAPSDMASTSVTDPLVDTINSPANGAIVAFARANSSAGFDWTNLTETLADVNVKTTTYMSEGSDAFAAAQTNRSITADTTSSATAILLMASWGP